MESEIQEVQNQNSFNRVTPFSKYLAMVLFVTMPFIGGWIGYTYAPAKTMPSDTPIKTIVDNSQTSDTAKDDQSDSSDKKLIFSTPINQSNLTAQISSEFDKEQWTNVSADVLVLLQEINYGWLEEIRFRTFSLQGIPGEVIHFCDKGNVIFDRNSNRMCLGENILVIEWNDNIGVIAKEDTPTQKSLFKLHEVFFNEGKFESVTESDSENAKLLIVVDELACVDVYADMCFSDFSLTHVVELPNLQVSQVDISPIGYGTGRSLSGSGSLISQWPLGEQFYWNQLGTKAVYSTPCPAGCPDQVLEGFSLSEQTIVPLLSRVDGIYNGIHGGRPSEDELSWTSDNLFKVGTTTFPF